jgi:hypothetical protein
VIRSIAALFLLAAALAGPAATTDRLVAIDVLLEPDQTMLAAAEAWNTRLREQTPEGFALDDTHRPHVTLLQTYVVEEELDAVLAALEQAASELDVAALSMEAVGLYHIPSGEIGLAGIVIEPTLELLDVQDAVIAALAPFRRSGGDQAAFVPDPTGTPFDPFLFSYVETFVPKQSGENFNPHVSTGVGPLAWLEAREAEPFDPFTFGATGIAVYRLGNFGTAAEKLAGF